MQVPLCMKFRFPIHDQMMAQCIIKMQDVLSAAAQSEPKRGGGRGRGGGLERLPACFSCGQLDDAQPACCLGGAEVESWNHWVARSQKDTA